MALPGISPYPVNPLAGAMDSGAGLIPLIMALRMHQQYGGMRNMPIGQALGYPAQAPQAPTPGPVQSMPGAGPTVPTASPVMGSDGTMTGEATPTFPTAPDAIRPMLNTPVGMMAHLRSMLGDPMMTNMMYGAGIRRTGDPMQLQYDPATGGFTLPAGTTKVSSKTANTLIRQRDVKNKVDLQAWRDAVEKRMTRGQMTAEERTAMGADHDLLNLMVSPDFDLLDPTIQSQLQAQATAAINRMQQRGVKVFTGSRAGAAAGAPAPAAPAPVRGASPATPPPPKVTPAVRYQQIKDANPNMQDQQIYAQMALEGI